MKINLPPRTNIHSKNRFLLRLRYAYPILAVSSQQLTGVFQTETLYSWCGAVHLENGFSSVLDTSRILFGNRYAGLLHDFPAHQENLIESTGLESTPMDLTLRHTLLGYFLPFKPQALSTFLLNKVTTGTYPQLKYKPGIPASRLGGYHPLKACPVCQDEQRNTAGRAFWQIEHQFPSSLICVKHRVPLQKIELSQSPVHLRTWMYPDTEKLKAAILLFPATKKRSFPNWPAFLSPSQMNHQGASCRSPYRRRTRAV